MFYFKKFISYIDYFEYGEKIKNAGHIRVIIEEKECTLDIHIKGLRNTDSLSVPIQTMQGSVLGKIELTQGSGRYFKTCPAADMDGLGTSIDDISGLQIQIAPDRYCYSVWKEPDTLPCAAEENIFEMTVRSDGLSEKGIIGGKFPKEQVSKESLREEQVSSGEFQEERIMNENLQEERISYGSPQEKESDISVIMKAEGKISDTAAEVREVFAATEKAAVREADITEKAVKEVLYPDKWQQLRHRYQNVHPFEKEDEFISIEPKDFIIMRQEYQNLVNNSFLLHGFYNYRHIILGRKNGNLQYYIGVPGTYYDREKMVAVMFGFEGFEVSGEDIADNHIEPGTYGYYMKRVNI